MPKVTIYTMVFCPYCHMAKRLLRTKGVSFEEIDVTGCTELRAKLCARAGGRDSVPQIWIGEQYVGGCVDLFALDRAGKLDALLGA